MKLPSLISSMSIIKNSRIKAFTVLVLMVAMTCSLSACGKNSVASKDGSTLRLTMDEIQKDEREGIFVMNKDKTFSPVVSDMPGYQGETEEADATRYVWYTDNEADITGLIPTVTPETPLVAIYNSNKDMPALWYLEKYKDKGYTIGAHIFLDEDKTMRIIADDMLSSSSASSVISEVAGKDEDFTIDFISGTKDDKLPINNVDENMEALLGFEKNKLYTFEFYRGTQTEKVDIYADTHIFQSTRYTELTNPFKKTSKGYFIMNLPLNLENGYYYLSDIGFFRYKS